MQEGVACHFGTAAREVVDVVCLHRDEVLRAGEVDAPISICVAGGRVRGGAVEVVVGEGYALVGRGSEDNVLSADSSCL